LHIADHEVAAVDRVVLPERRVLHAVALQQHVGAADQLDHRRAQVVADAEDAWIGTPASDSAGRYCASARHLSPSP
jgi:hypothetical protein